MSRRASLPQSIELSSLVTPRIIQGRGYLARNLGSAIFAANCEQIARAYRLTRGGPKLLAAARLFGAVESQSRILHQLRHDRYKVVPYLIDLASRSAEWLRAPEDFRPRATHGRDQIVELTHHLFAAYRVPAWLERALPPKRGRPAQAPAFGWYVHVAQGRSLRTASKLSVPLSRRAAHEALSAPARSRPEQALLYGFLQGSGATPAVRDALLHEARVDRFVVDETWLKLFEKIARMPALPVGRVLGLLEYVKARRTEGACVDRPLPTLLLAMDRRNAERRELLVQKQAATYGPAFDQRWVSGVPATPLAGSCDAGHYTFVELCTFREIFEEGQLMQHCVFDYAGAARAGTVSIWSLRIVRTGHDVGRVTIRVIASERTVVEARRRCNESIKPYERELIRSWALQQGWSLGSAV